ncbi:MAG TPA: type II secretion system F family protein [Beijerinckiaceae bacterium]|jgi:tight adherence protein C
MDLIDAVLDFAADEPGLVLGLILLCALTFGGIAAWSALRGHRDVRRRAADSAAEGSSPEARRAETRRTLERLVTHLESTFAGNAADTKVLKARLIQAGYYDPRAVGAFFAARFGGALALGVAGLAVAALLFEADDITIATGGTALALVGYLAPSFLLDKRIKARAAAHRAGFPDFMDLMIVCSEAGLSMEAGIERIARELVEGYPSLAENLYMASLEIRAGKGLTEALDRMGDRLAIEEAKMLATLLQQSAELGTSLSQSLKVYSDEMRHKRMSRAEEKAYALPAKLVIPLTLFVFPVLLVTLMLPVVVKVSEMMKG